MLPVVLVLLYARAFPVANIGCTFDPNFFVNLKSYNLYFFGFFTTTSCLIRAGGHVKSYIFKFKALPTRRAYYSDTLDHFEHTKFELDGTRTTTDTSTLSNVVIETI